MLREHLTFSERMRNIERLRREAEAKMVHADALQAETDLLIRSAKLSDRETAGRRNGSE